MCCMHKHSSSQSFEEQLRLQGWRVTPVRLAMLEFLCHATTPAAVSDILLALKRAGKIVNKTTVYRELEFLRTQGIVVAVRVDEAKVLYEIKSHDHHHHAVCSECGTIVDIANPALEKAVTVLANAVKQDYGFVVQEHSVELFGLCQRCQSKK